MATGRKVEEQTLIYRGKRECESGKWSYLSLPDLLIS